VNSTSPVRRTPRAVLASFVAISLIFGTHVAEAFVEGSTVRIALGCRARIALAGGSGHRLVGAISAMDDDSITIEAANGSQVRALRSDIRSLEIRVERVRSTGKGMAIGAASTGALLGVFVLASVTRGACSAPADRGCLKAEELVGVGAPLLAGGVLWGAFLGAQVRQDRWMAVTSDAVALEGLAALGARPISAGPAAPRVESPTPVIRPLPGSNLSLGTRLRVRTDGRSVEGPLMGLSPQTLTVAGTAGVMEIQSSRISRIETWGGERTQSRRAALIGALSMTALSLVNPSECELFTERRTPCSRAASTFEALFAGAVVGAGVGRVVKRTDWIPVPLDRATLQGEARARGVSARLSPILHRFGRGAGLRLHVAW
jgi:hypothetical protein